MYMISFSAAVIQYKVYILRFGIDFLAEHCEQFLLGCIPTVWPIAALQKYAHGFGLQCGYCHRYPRQPPNIKDKMVFVQLSQDQM